MRNEGEQTGQMERIRHQRFDRGEAAWEESENCKLVCSTWNVDANGHDEV